MFTMYHQDYYNFYRKNILLDFQYLSYVLQATDIPTVRKISNTKTPKNLESGPLQEERGPKELHYIQDGGG